MASGEILDKRLLERKLRQGKTSPSEVEEALKALPDLADNVKRPEPEELERLAEELESERTARAERIERALSAPAETELPPTFHMPTEPTEPEV